MNINKFNTFLSTLNFVLFFIGYQLITSLFLPTSSDIEGISRTVTIPYRAFALLISSVVIFLNHRNGVKNTPLALKLLWIYWIALILRIFYDTEIRIDVQLNEISKLWFFIFGIILPAIYSIMISYQIIDLDKALKWIYLGTIFTMILSLFNNDAMLVDSDEIVERVSGNLALNTIAFGHLGAMGVLLSLFILFKRKKRLIETIIYVSVIILSFFIMLRSGSRSPILAFVVVILFWLFARGKNIMLGLGVTVIASILIILFIDPILNSIGTISPFLEHRLRLSIFEGNTSGRDTLYEIAFFKFLDKPFLGSQFAIFNKFGEFSYPHNIVLEAFMALGVLGGLIMIFILFKSLKSSYLMIKNNDDAFWTSLILIQQIVLGMLGQFYYNQILNILLAFIILYSDSKIKKYKAIPHQAYMN